MWVTSKKNIEVGDPDNWRTQECIPQDQPRMGNPEVANEYSRGNKILTTEFRRKCAGLNRGYVCVSLYSLSQEVFTQFKGLTQFLRKTQGISLLSYAAAATDFCISYNLSPNISLPFRVSCEALKNRSLWRVIPSCCIRIQKLQWWPWCGSWTDRSWGE